MLIEVQLRIKGGFFGEINPGLIEHAIISFLQSVLNAN
jgi:hypothetical protein